MFIIYHSAELCDSKPLVKLMNKAIKSQQNQNFFEALYHQMHTNIGFGYSEASLVRFYRSKQSQNFGLGQNLSKLYVIKNSFSKANTRFFSSFFWIFENQ